MPTYTYKLNTREEDSSWWERASFSRHLAGAEHCAPHGTRADTALVGTGLTTQSRDCFHALNVIYVEKVSLNLGPGHLLRASQVSFTKPLYYVFILRKSETINRFWIISLPRTISVTAYSVV